MLVLTALSCASPRRAEAQISSIGRWLGPHEIDGVANEACYTATHLAILRGRCDTTVVLHYNGSVHNEATPCQTAYPRLLLIPPGSEGPPSFANALQVSAPLPAGSPDIFCSGHTTMKDGRLLVVGGTSQGTNGHKYTFLFDPTHYSDAQWYDATLGATFEWGWLNLASDTMRYERWYPTLLQLGDDRVVVGSGLRYFESLFLGGEERVGQTIAPTAFHGMLAHTYGGQWTEYPYRGLSKYATRPSARREHAAEYASTIQMFDSDARGAVMLFGGHDGTNPLDDFWVGWRTGYNPSESWAWVRVQPASGAPWPAARSEHSLVVAPGALNNTCDVWVYGGKDASGNALGDLWRITFTVVPGGDADNETVVATQITTDTGRPSARYGHAAAYDESPLNTAQSPVTRHMLVHGGRTASGSSGFAENALHSLDLASLAWTVVTPAASAAPKRYRHTAVMDGPAPHDAASKPRRLLVFGGEGESGLRGDLWKFGRCNNANSCMGNYTAAQIVPETGTAAPSARYRHAAHYDEEWDRLWVHGGDSTMTGGLSAASWSFTLSHEVGVSGGPPLRWRSHLPDSLRAGPHARAGHVSLYFDVDVNERQMEVFDITKPAGQRYTDLAGGRVYDRAAYPFYFNHPSGGVLHAGRNVRTVVGDGGTRNSAGTRVIGISGNTGTIGDTTRSYTGGTSAIGFEQGRVMKLGPYIGTVSPSHATVSTFEASGALGAWAQETISGVSDFQPQPRVEPNLTVLLDGRVFVSGGRDRHEDEGNPFLIPQIWDPSSSSWTPRSGNGVLPPDPSARGYHSTAALLPDGRVISAGGNVTHTQTTEKDKPDSATVYEPGYLFTTSGTTATRPVFSVADDLLHGQTFQIVSGDAAAITRVVLVRPGATTHAFNHDQRYTALSFEQASSTVVTATAPADPDLMPPGNYLLFVLATTDGPSPTPSVGRWVTLGGSGTMTPQVVNDLAMGYSEGCPPYEQLDAEIEWTAPADDAGDRNAGPMYVYKLKYHTAALTESNFESVGVEVATPTPACPGRPEVVAPIQSLQPNTWYYARLKSRMIAGPIDQWTALSNQAQFKGYYIDCGEGLSGGGGGGCSECVRSGRQDLRFRAVGLSGTSFAASTSNSLFDGTPNGADAADALALPGVAADAGGGVSAWIRAPRRVGAMLDRVALAAIERSSEEVGLLQGGDAIVGTPFDVSGAMLDGSTPLDSALAFAADDPVYVPPGSTLEVSLPGGASQAVLLEGRRSAALTPGEPGVHWSAHDTAGVVVASGGWRPRRGFALFALRAPGASRLRLTAAVGLYLKRLEGLTTRPGTTASFVAPHAASVADRGLELSALAGRDSSVEAISPGDSLHLAFALPPVTPGLVRDLHLVVEGGPETAAQASMRSGRTPRAEAARPGFWLAPNVPNPFEHATTFRFALPERSPVRLEVYDLAGRVVRRFEGTYEAGEHTLSWDRTDASGSPVRAGVHFVRLRAGAHRAHRMLVVR